MKKVFSLVAALVICATTFAGVYPARLCLLGDATPGGWSLDDFSTMETTSDGHYTWTGTLNSGALKFVFYKDWTPGYGPAEADAPLTVGTTATLAYRGSDADADNKFAVVAGTYTIDIDLTTETPTLTVSDGTGKTATGKPSQEYGYLFPIGDATPWGWTTGDSKSHALVETSFCSGILTGTIELGGSGELKFLVRPDWGTQFGPSVNGLAIDGEGEYDCVLGTGDDNKYKVSLKGTYPITIDLNQNKMIIGGTAGIKATNVATSADAEVYNVAGQRVNPAQKGLVIKNGRTYLNK